MFVVKRLMHKRLGYMNVSDVHQEAVLRSQGWVDDDGKELAAKLARIKAEQEKAQEPPEPTVESVRAELEKRGIRFDYRWGLKRLLEL